MVEIKNRKDLKAWLRERPREDAVMLAVRAALRVLPLVYRYDAIFDVFRATAATWVAALERTRDSEIVRAVADAHAGADSSSNTDISIEAKFAICSAAAAAKTTYADVADVSRIAISASADAGAALALNRLSLAARTASWSNVLGDATRLENGQSPAQVAAMPLWIDTPPAQIRNGWPKFRKRLLNYDEG